MNTDPPFPLRWPRARAPRTCSRRTASKRARRLTALLNATLVKATARNTRPRLFTPAAQALSARRPAARPRGWSPLVSRRPARRMHPLHLIARCPLHPSARQIHPLHLIARRKHPLHLIARCARTSRPRRTRAVKGPPRRGRGLKGVEALYLKAGWNLTSFLHAPYPLGSGPSPSGPSGSSIYQHRRTPEIDM